MAIYTVTTSDDVVDGGDGVLSLREALAQANADAAGGTIEFAQFIQHTTITLTQGTLEIEGKVAIDGGIGGVTIDGDHKSTVVSVSGSADINHMTIVNGQTFNSGAGISVFNADLSLSNSTITGCVITNPVNAGEGAGMTARGNSTVILTNCTISGNTIQGDGGTGAGIVADADLTLDHCTITGNSAGGPNSSGGGISLFAKDNPKILNGTIIVGNDAAQAPDVDQAQPDLFTSDGHNIFGSQVVGLSTTDLQGIPASVLFADLATVPGSSVQAGVPHNHGGPTPTIALLDQASNLAVAHGAADGPATDQRGAPRPAPGDTDPDVGAFELRQTFSAVQGSLGNDRLHGAAVADDHLQGGRGHDRLFGHGGGDWLEGGVGHDRLFGGRDTDLLYGGAGNDRLFGGKAGDLLYGGAGADRFVFVGASDSPPGGLHDRIFDFSAAEGDRIDLRKLDGDPDRAGNQRLEFIGDDPFSEAGQVRAILAGGQTLVEINLDHDHRAELAIDMAGSVQLHARDFLL